MLLEEVVRKIFERRHNLSDEDEAMLRFMMKQVEHSECHIREFVRSHSMVIAEKAGCSVIQTSARHPNSVIKTVLRRGPVSRADDHFIADVTGENSNKPSIGRMKMLFREGKLLNQLFQRK